MATPHKSVFVPDEGKQEFDNTLIYILNELGMNYSEFSRQVVMKSSLVSKGQISSFAAKEARKSDNYTYLVLPVKV